MFLSRDACCTVQTREKRRTCNNVATMREPESPPHEYGRLIKIRTPHPRSVCAATLLPHCKWLPNNIPLQGAEHKAGANGQATNSPMLCGRSLSLLVFKHSPRAQAEEAALMAPNRNFGACLEYCSLAWASLAADTPERAGGRYAGPSVATLPCLLPYRFRPVSIAHQATTI